MTTGHPIYKQIYQHFYNFSWLLWKCGLHLLLNNNIKSKYSIHIFSYPIYWFSLSEIVSYKLAFQWSLTSANDQTHFISGFLLLLPSEFCIWKSFLPLSRKFYYEQDSQEIVKEQKRHIYWLESDWRHKTQLHDMHYVLKKMNCFILDNVTWNSSHMQIFNIW